MVSLAHITFLYPYLFVLFLLYLLCETYCKKKLPTMYFSNIKMLQRVSQKKGHLNKIIRYLILLSMLTALATPVIQKQHTLKKNKKAYEIALVLDASDSMHQDHRFEITKQIVEDFINSRVGDKIGLTLFADFAYIASPLTKNKKNLQDILKYIQLGTAGSRDTALYESLYLSPNLFSKNKIKNKIIILLTDGINTVNTISLNIALKKIKKHGIKVYTIGVGKKGDYDKKILERIANETKGRFYETDDPKKLQNIYDSINALEKGKVSTLHYTQNIHLFHYILYLTILLFVLLFILNKNAHNSSYLVVSFIFVLISLYAPKISNDILHPDTNKALDFTVAFDISDSMLCKDVYPDRLGFAKNKFYDILKYPTTHTISLIAFAKEPYLISLGTKDYKALKYLVQNIKLDTIDTKGSSILGALRATNKISRSKKVKKLLIFTDGGDKTDFNKEIKYAREHNISVYIYSVATALGADIKIKGNTVKEPNGDIVVSHENQFIYTLSKHTNGLYAHHSLDRDDIKLFLKDMASKDASQAKEDIGFDEKTEFFYLPLLISLLLFIMATLYFKRRER